MFPFVYGFTWSTGPLIFLGIFFTVVVTVAVVFLRAVRRSAMDFSSGRSEAILWKQEFHDLSPSLRRCRHELNGEVPCRECPNGFDCRLCDDHPRFLAQHPVAPAPAETVLGFRMPSDRLYHRGHTWVKSDGDGFLAIGLDDFASRVIGHDARLELPAAGSKLRANGTAWRVRRNGSAVRVLSPVDGVVVEAGSPGAEWVLKVKPGEAEPNLDHLLRGAEVHAWMMREVERLQMRLADTAVGVTLADGGEPVGDFPKSAPEGPWRDVCDDVFLTA